MSGLFDEEPQAEFSPCRTWRYLIRRQWSDGPCVMWLCFNPSVATETINDHSVLKMIGFSKRWGYGRLVLANLFAYCSTDPKAIARVVDPVGPMNDIWIGRAAEEAREVICAWGCGQHMKVQKLAGRPLHVMKVLALMPSPPVISCLGYREDRHPRHPLMLAYDTEREPYQR